MGKDVFLSFREAHEAGFRYVESFINYFMAFLDKPAELRKQIDDIGVKFVTISNGGPLEMAFEDPAKREKLLADHMRLVRFIKQLGLRPFKVNTNVRRPNGHKPRRPQADGDHSQRARQADHGRGTEIRRPPPHVDTIGETVARLMPSPSPPTRAT